LSEAKIIEKIFKIVKAILEHVYNLSQLILIDTEHQLKLPRLNSRVIRTEF
jgi:hypothetical protein